MDTVKTFNNSIATDMMHYGYILMHYSCILMHYSYVLIINYGHS